MSENYEGMMIKQDFTSWLHREVSFLTSEGYLWFSLFVCVNEAVQICCNVYVILYVNEHFVISFLPEGMQGKKKIYDVMNILCVELTV